MDAHGLLWLTNVTGPLVAAASLMLVLWADRGLDLRRTRKTTRQSVATRPRLRLLSAAEDCHGDVGEAHLTEVRPTRQRPRRFREQGIDGLRPVGPKRSRTA